MLNFWALKISRKENKFAGWFLIAELGDRELWDTMGNFQIVLKSQNKSLLKSSHPKEYLPNFTTQKNPGIENFKPKKILWSSLSLEIRSTPPPLPRPWRFLGRFGLKTGIDFAYRVSFEETVGVYERIYHFSSKWLRKKEKYANSK